MWLAGHRVQVLTIEIYTLRPCTMLTTPKVRYIVRVCAELDDAMLLRQHMEIVTGNQNNPARR